MYTFITSIIILLGGYYFYGRYLEKVFGVEPDRLTPAVSMTDGVDFLPLPWWKIFLIQFLNIAGLGPIFGAIAGAMWGPVAFLWIVFGSLLGGGVHDYFSGMLSLRNKGMSLGEIIGKYLGRNARFLMTIFTLMVLILVGAVFIAGPAKILSDLTGGGETSGGLFTVQFWVFVILIYYILATLLPVDKIIGRLYPIFGLALFLMAVLILGAMFVQGLKIPELNLSSLTNMHHDAEKFPVFPLLFITIACGAVSGFHATQSPMMARCITNEKHGRRIFYGAMITEAVVAMVWAAVAMCFFGGVGDLNEIMVAEQGNAALIVNEISNGLLGSFGAVLVAIGVVVAPITSGDTAFRGARLIVADFLKWDQSVFIRRLIISIPLFVIGFGLTQMDFAVLWRYFAWSNQTIAAVTLWTVTVYLSGEGKNFWIALVPSVFMTMVVVSYILIAPEGFNLPYSFSIWCGIGTVVLILGKLFFDRRSAYQSVLGGG